MEHSVKDISKRAGRLLKQLSETINNEKKEFDLDKYQPSFSKSAATELPMLSKAKVDKAVNELEADGYIFNKKDAGNSKVYDLSIDDIVEIYHKRGEPKYRDKFGSAHVVFLANLKGGASKTVSTVTLAHGFRAVPNLIHNDLRILVLDLDPQASATMFLRNDLAASPNDATVAQAMLQNVTREELLDEFVFSSSMNCVDIMPASLTDGFIASNFENLVNEHLSSQNQFSVLRENVIDKIKHDYDFIFIDTGPHLDAFLLNAMVAAHSVFIPVPPDVVDFHSSLQFLQRLPNLYQMIENEGCELKHQLVSTFMTKTERKPQHETYRSILRQVCGNNMLDVSIPQLAPFRRTGESFDTVFSVNPKYYTGDRQSLKNARTSAEEFTQAIFDTITFNRK